jgi:hypothetical protein
MIQRDKEPLSYFDDSQNHNRLTITTIKLIDSHLGGRVMVLLVKSSTQGRTEANIFWQQKLNGEQKSHAAYLSHAV